MSHETPSVPDVMTAREVAKYLRIRKERVYQLLEGGEIRGKKVGKTALQQWRVLKSEVDRFLLSNSVDAPEKPITGHFVARRSPQWNFIK